MNRTRLLVGIGMVALSCRWSVPAVAQDLPNVGAEPTYATLSLTSGFSDDPRTFDLTAGGTLAVGGLGLGCAGSVESRPQIRLTYEASTVLPLNIYATSDEDITLVVNQPDGSWICNDDYDGTNPAILVDKPQSGRYEVWVGVYGGGQAGARLFLSELTPEFGPGEAAALDLDADPSYATLNLSAAFADDPRTVSLRAGGTIEVTGLGDGCAGSVDAAPHVRLNYAAGQVLPLNIYATTTTDGDLTLIVNRPDGSWVCSDDYEGRHPAVLMESPQSGQYDIWVGEYFGEYVNATLFITELEPDL
jgi:serine protease Do